MTERAYLREHSGRTSHLAINRRLAHALAHVCVHVHPTRASLNICKHACTYHTTHPLLRMCACAHTHTQGVGGRSTGNDPRCPCLMMYCGLCPSAFVSPTTPPSWKREPRPLGHPQLTGLEPCRLHLHLCLLSTRSTCVSPFLCPQHYSKPNHHVPRLPAWRWQGLLIPPPVSPLSSQPLHSSLGGRRGLHKSGFERPPCLKSCSGSRFSPSSLSPQGLL